MAEDTLVELPDFALEWRVTQRGFARADFVDTYGNRCSIQESSSAMPRLWLGVDEPARAVLPPGLRERDHAFLRAHMTRMHLSKSQALALGRALVAWAEGQDDPVFGDDDGETR